MPRYCFKVYEGTTLVPSDPVELPDYETARAEAVIFVGETLKDVDGKFWNQGDWRVDVTDHTGLILCSLFIAGVEAAAVRANAR